MSDIHPILTSFPITLIFLALLAEVIYYFNHKDFWLKMNLIVLSLGVAFTLLAFVTGLLAISNLNGLAPQTEDLISTHYSIAKLILFTFIPLILFRVLRFERKILNILYLLLLVIQFGLIVYTSNLGGTLVFSHGVGVVVGVK